MTMRLIDLNPAFVGSGGDGITDSNGDPVPERTGIGLAFDCPCGCGTRAYVSFENPMDGKPPTESAHPIWVRNGETFEDLTLSPSILRSDPDGCSWHGFIRDGAIVQA